MEDGRSFFKSGLQDLHDPFLMKGMDKAVERLQQALEEGQKVLVYGDYDVRWHYGSVEFLSLS